MIGGMIYKNCDHRLPEKPGRIWCEADFDYVSGIRNGRRLLYSNDGLLFATYLWLSVWSAETPESMLTRKTSEKVKKRSFREKRAFFMVDDTGLEPVTSRTSTQKCDFL